MLLVSSAAAAMQRSRQVHVNGRDYTLAEYVGAAPKHGVYVGQAGLDLLVLQFPALAAKRANATA
jgi:hypothetical protein